MDQFELWREQVQVSDAGRWPGPRVPRVFPAVALACWAAGALVFALLPFGSDAKSLITTTFSLATAAFAAVVLLRAAPRAEGHERAFLRLMGWGMFFRLVGNALWSASWVTGADGAVSVAPQDVAYAISYPLLVGAMLHLVALATRRITLVSALDAGAVMLSVGTLAWYFVLGPAEVGLGNPRDAVVALSQPVCDAALLFLGLVVASSPVRPRFSAYLNGGFVALLVADAAYLGLRSVGPYQSGHWPEMLWALGMSLLGLTSTSSPEVPADPAIRRVQPWRVLLFWFGPLSPPVQFVVLLAWGVLNPPLPAYALAACAVLLLYMALRVGLVSLVTRRLSEEREDSARRAEQSRLLYELHDTVKQSVHGISLTLSAALDAERRGDGEVAREMFKRALAASRETEFRVTRPYDELQIAIHGEDTLRPKEYLRHRLERFEEYFGIKTYEDFQAPLEALDALELAAVYRVVVEAFWNAAKHSGARNMYLESRRVGDLQLLRVRDDGRGFDPSNPPLGMGLRYLRESAREVGAELDVISAPGRGTTVQLRFRARKNPQGPELSDG